MIRLLAAMVAALLFAGSSFAQSNDSGEKVSPFDVTPLFGIHSGQHSYEIAFRYYEELGGDTVIASGRSKLEFPLDGSRFGVRLGWNLSPEAKSDWFAEATILTAMSDPSESMIDSDWESLPETAPEILWSYTESGATNNQFIVDVEIGRHVHRKTNFNLALVFGLAYHRFEQDVLGFNGWQIFEGERYNISGSGVVGYYRATYIMPNAGLKLQSRLQKGLAFNLAVKGARMFADDYDDHILRGKDSESSPSGFAGMGRFSLRLDAFETDKSKYFVELWGHGVAMSADGKQTQTWYRDEMGRDPNSGEPIVVVEKGTVISGIPITLESEQYGIGLGLGLSF